MILVVEVEQKKQVEEEENIRGKENKKRNVENLEELVREEKLENEDDAENDAYSKAKWLLVGLCSLAVAVLSASALCLFVPDFEFITEDECECCGSADAAKEAKP